jgi:molybdopterin molybdotransferase
LVRNAVQRCGVGQLFWRVNIKPGMPLFVGKHRRTLVFGLPGNPVSVFVTFEEFVKPALYRLMGRGWQDPYREPAVLTENLRISRTRRTHFIRVRCSQHNQLVAEPLDGQGSHWLRSLVEADGWIRMNVGQGPWSAGTQVLVKRGSV